MKLRPIDWFGSFLAALALTGCDTGRQAVRETGVRVANVAPSFSELQFRREQTQPATLPFRGATETSYDEDTYDFFIEQPSFQTGPAGQVHTWVQAIDASFIYTVVLTERAGILEHVVLEHSPLTLGSTDAQVVGVNATPGVAAIDVYLERPGVGIAGATPRASGAFLEPWTPLSLPNGEYELWLTEAGNPANVLLTSGTLVLAPGATTTFLVTPEAGAGTEEISVLMLAASPVVLFDRNAAAGLRVINAAADTLPRDFIINNQFSSPLFTAIPFAEPTAYATIPAAAAQPIHVTPGGYPAVLELSGALTTSQSELATVLVAGDAGVLTHAVSFDDNRRIAGEGRLRFFHAANQFTTPIDFVVVPTGGDLTTAFPRAILAVPGISNRDALQPGTYDLGLRTYNTSTILAGPISITVEAGGIYGVLAVNGPDTATATVVLLDDFP